AQGVLHEEPSAPIAHARVCEGRGWRGYGCSYTGTKPETADTAKPVGLRLRPVLSYSEGYERIVGELKGLGIPVSPTPLRNILRANRLGPAGHRPGTIVARVPADAGRDDHGGRFLHGGHGLAAPTVGSVLYRSRKSTRAPGRVHGASRRRMGSAAVATGGVGA